MEKLKTEPNDEAANLTVGKYRCFVQGRWADGLKLLTRGGNVALKGVAELDLQTPALGAPDVKVADAWWDYAQTAPDSEKRAAEARARFWYTRAVPGLAGLQKARAESRCGFTVNGIEYRPGLVAEFSAKQAAILKGVRARIDPVIDFSGKEFAATGTGRNAEMGVKWSGSIQPHRPGRYRLVANTADPVRVKVDGKIVIDTIAVRTGRSDAGVMLLDRPTSVVVEFTTTNAAQHMLRLTWVPPGGIEEELVPADVLFHDRKAEAAIGK
jgi:hypothetical protein